MAERQSGIRGDMFSGWAMVLVPGEDFEAPADLIMESVDEEGEFDYYELPIPTETAVEPSSAVYQNPMPLADEQQAWASLCIALKALAQICGGKADAFQSNRYEGGNLVEAVFTFRYEPGDRGYSGGRL